MAQSMYEGYLFVRFNMDDQHRVAIFFLSMVRLEDCGYTLLIDFTKLYYIAGSLLYITQYNLVISMRFKNFKDTCSSHIRCIGKLLSASSDMLEVPQAMGFIMQEVVHYIPLDTMIHIGMRIEIITSLFQHMFLVLDATTFVGMVKINPKFICH